MSPGRVSQVGHPRRFGADLVVTQCAVNRAAERFRAGRHAAAQLTIRVDHEHGDFLPPFRSVSSALASRVLRSVSVNAHVYTTVKGVAETAEKDRKGEWYHPLDRGSEAGFGGLRLVWLLTSWGFCGRDMLGVSLSVLSRHLAVV